VLTDLVALVRHALMPAMTLVPYRDELRERYPRALAKSCERDLCEVHAESLARLVSRRPY
jgi:hypothetical protein